MHAPVLFLTGPPGVGKTTLVERLFEHHTHSGIMVCGIVTREVRSEGTRVGFKIQDLLTGEEGWLAKSEGTGGPRVGRYGVNSADLDRIGTMALEKAARGEAMLVLVDEIGPMEMTSQGFRRAISELLRSPKTLVATVKQGSQYPEVEEAMKSKKAQMLEVTIQNRDGMLENVISLIDPVLQAAGASRV